MKQIVSKELIDKHREINIHDEWYEHEYADFTAAMEEIGVHVERIYFSGFWSQGDGACFEGHIEDWGKYLCSIGVTDPILIKEANDGWTFSWTQRGRYYHHKSVNFDDSGVYFPPSPYSEDDLRHDVWTAVMNTYDLLKLCDDIREDLEGHMKKLYRSLEEDYNYLTSDECVRESIIDNDLLTEAEEN